MALLAGVADQARAIVTVPMSFTPEGFLSEDDAEGQRDEIARRQDDLIVSDALTSLLMAQLSERGELLAVFEQLFDPEGAVVSLVDAATLVPAEPLDFAAVVAAASAQRASAFGYRLASDGQLYLNPEKTRTVTLGEGDQILVIKTRDTSPLLPPVHEIAAATA